MDAFRMIDAPSGISEHNIELALLPLDLREEAIKVAEVRHVSLYAGYVSSDFLNRCSQFRLTAPSYEDVRAFFHKLLCRRKANAAIATSNECNFSFELVHVFLSSHQTLSDCEDDSAEGRPSTRLRRASAWCNGARLVDDLAYVGAQVQLDVAALLEALLERLLDDGGRGRAGDGLREGVHLGGQRVVGGKRRSVDEALDVGQREQVETRDPLREGIDEANELRVGNGAVDVSVPLGEFSVEVLTTEQDLERPPATDDAWQTGRGAAPGHGGEPDLELPQHGPLPTGEPDVGGEGELAARTASPAPESSDRHRPRPAEPDQHVRPVMKRGGRRRQRVEGGLIGCDVVVGQEEVRVGAVEDHDGHPVVLLDLGEQVMQRDDHHRVDEVDRRVVEGHSPQRRRRSV